MFGYLLSFCTCLCPTLYLTQDLGRTGLTGKKKQYDTFASCAAALMVFLDEFGDTIDTVSNSKTLNCLSHPHV